MRLSEFVRTLMCLGLSGGMCLLAVGQISAQELLPAIRWNVDSGNWTDGGNWVLAGSDPAETGVPSGDEIASIRNGGTAIVNSNVADGGKALAITDGTVQLVTGGSLTIGGQAVVGAGGTLALGGGSLTSDSFSIVDGTIDLSTDVAGDLTVGNVYPVATASSVGGLPGRITVGGSHPNLPLGQRLIFGSNDSGAVVTLREVPVLQFDRVTGETTIKNFGTAPVDLKGYSITSAGDHLLRVGGRWNSLADQGVEGWNDSLNNTRTSRFSEYNLTGSTMIGPNDSVSIGTPYNGVGENFLTPAEEDFKVSFFLGDGTVLDGDVNYLGAPNDFVLTIDPATGAATLGNTSSVVDPFDVASYSITSSSGSLLPDNFTGLGEEGWVNANPQTTGLAELNLEGSKLFSENTVVSIGDIFNPEGQRDLRFQYSVADGFLRTGSIIYGQPTGVVECTPLNALLGDLDGNGEVAFADFLVLAENFGAQTSNYADGDVDCNGTVAFADFLILAENFGQTVGQASAASVPEPSAVLLIGLGFLGMLKFRRRIPAVAAVLAAVCLCTMTQDSFADDFDTRFIRIHPDGPNNAINNVVEARGILNGTVLDVIKNEDLTGKLDIIDLAGGGGQFSINNPYLNGVNDDSMSNFLQYVSGVINIPEGDWTIGCGSDDGCLINMPGITFTNTYNENGPTIAGDGEIIFNPGRGHDWTFATFSVPAGGIETGFEALFNEGGGGDSFEVGIADLTLDPAVDLIDNAENRNATAFSLLLELADGELDWDVTGAPFMAGSPADFNGDGVVNLDDEGILRGNFGEAGVGDLNSDGIVDFHDLARFVPIFEAAQPAGAQSVPEPVGLSLLVIGATALLGLRRRR